MKQYLALNYFALVFVLLAINTTLSAQKRGKELIDSLQKRIASYSSDCNYTCLKDSTKVNLILNLAWEYNNSKPDTVPILCATASGLSKSIKYATGLAQSHHVVGVYYHSRKEDYENAIKSFTSELAILDQLLATEKNAKLILSKKAACFNSISNIYSKKGDYWYAIDFLEKALKINESFNNWEGIAINNANIGSIFFDIGEYSKSLEQFFKALKIIEKNNINKAMAAVLGRIGRVYRTMGDLPRALENYTAALEINRKNNDKSGMAINYQSIGLVYRSQNNTTKELECYSNALTLFTEIKSKTGIAVVNSSIGSAYNDKADKQIKSGENDSAMANYQTALNYFVEAAKIQEGVTKNTVMADYLGNIGVANSGLKKYDEAEKYLLQALELAESLEYLDGIKSANEELSELYLKSGKYEKAISHYKKSVAAKDSLINVSKTIEITTSGLNFTFERKQDSINLVQEKQLAIAALEKRNALEQAERKRQIAISESNILILEAENEKILAESNLEISEANRQKAISEIENKIALSEVDKKRSLAEANAKKAAAETEAKEQAYLKNFILAAAGILLLSSILIFSFYKRRRDAVQKQKETSLNLQVSETEMKALRSQMNPHFIFNAQQSIQTFLLNHKPDDANTYLLKFSKLMRLVLENSQHSEVPLKEDMQALELYMQLESIRLKHPFTYQFHIADGIDPEETTIPPLILQPFVENAIWHGLQYKPEPGHIDIYISKQNETLHAVVEDNGVGRDMSKKVAQPMLLKKESLGMKLTEERLKILNELKKIKAYFKITDLFTKDQQPAGTKVELSLPL